jgi:CheY-like chemotaxis protein
MNQVQILLLSEVFLSKDLLDSALSKSSISYQFSITGSINDALQRINLGSCQILVTDTYMIAPIPEDVILQMIQLNRNVSFLLISYSHEEQSILDWFDFGFTDVVTSNNPLSLILSIKREFRIHQNTYN